MPVLSPHRSSSLSGSYRPSSYGSLLDRPIYSPRSVKNYSERYSSKTYTDGDGRRVYSRSGSITEDGVTTRFREEHREGSSPRDYLDYSRRDGSATRDRDRTTSTVGVFESVAELRNKYSPANYVPAVLRNRNDNISRSKSINDIGLPPIDTKQLQLQQQATASSKLKKVPESAPNGLPPPPTNTNNPNNDNSRDYDDTNGNNRESVADLCRKFQTPERTEKSPSPPTNNTTITTSSSTSAIAEPTVKIAENRFKKLDQNGTSTNGGSTVKKVVRKKKVADVVQENGIVGGAVSEGAESVEARPSARVNQCASYISSKELPNNDSTAVVNGDVDEKSEIPSRSSISPPLQPPNQQSTTSTSTNSGSTIAQSRRPQANSSTATPSDAPPTDPASTTNKTMGLNGLKNIGNTCFMNSVIQCLSNTRQLSEYLRTDAHLKEVNTSISSMRGALIKAFAQVVKELWHEDGVVNTTALKSQIQRFAPRFMGYAQQDAQEFLRYLLEGLHEDVNRVTEKPKPILEEIDDRLSDVDKSREAWRRYLRMDDSRILDLFVGQLKSTLRCTFCGHCSVTFDPFWDLSLPIPQRTGQVRLAQCLDSFTREETLDGDEKPTCSKCKERRKCTKSFTIQKFPKILVIHLKRFSPTERFRGKLSVTVDFPLESLDMSNYAADAVSPCRYNLYAISNHSGTTYSGHYTAYCRHPYNHQWYEYNDSRVSPISPRSIVSGEAYVLFYEQEGQKSHL